jgi:hypothetical protein
MSIPRNAPDGHRARGRIAAPTPWVLSSAIQDAFSSWTDPVAASTAGEPGGRQGRGYHPFASIFTSGCVWSPPIRAGCRAAPTLLPFDRCIHPSRRRPTTPAILHTRLPFPAPVPMPATELPTRHPEQFTGLRRRQPALREPVHKIRRSHHQYRPEHHRPPHRRLPNRRRPKRTTHALPKPGAPALAIENKLMFIFLESFLIVVLRVSVITKSL